MGYREERNARIDQFLIHNLLRVLVHGTRALIQHSKLRFVEQNTRDPKTLLLSDRQAL